MTRLSINSTPYERTRDCSFAERFVSSAEVVANKGTVTGTPTIDFGATLNGTTDYITYDLSGREFNNTKISIVIEFEPNFNFNEDMTRYLFSSSSSNSAIIKFNNALSNALRIDIGSTIASIPSATYSPYWKVGERNIIVVSALSGNTSAWLNGNIILANAAAVWFPTFDKKLFIGAQHAGGFKFKGKITSFKILNGLLDQTDATALYNNTFGKAYSLPYADIGNLNTNSTPAERARGCSFAELFKSQARVVSNGGTITGTPTINFGATFNGTTDYISYNGQLDKSNKGSLYAMVYPTTIASENVIFSIGGDTSPIFKLTYSTSSKFEIRVNDGVNNNFIQTTSTFAKDNFYSVVFVSTGSAYKVFVNGVDQPLTVALGLNNGKWLDGFTFSNPKTYIGAQEFNGTIYNRYKGLIKIVKYFYRDLTQGEATTFYNNSTYNYRNSAILDLPMRAAQHEATRTLDVSGNGNHAILNGTITKRGSRGYKGNGTGYFSILNNTSAYNEISINTQIIADEFAGSRYIWTIKESGGSIGLALRITSLGQIQIIHNTGTSAVSSGFNICKSCSYNISFLLDSSDKASLYVNGKSIISAVSLTINDRSGDSFIFGDVSPLIGSVLRFDVTPFYLNHTQVADLSIEMEQRINRV